ncbi:hypothetical protein CN692_12230 [Bacillus sp. AFS002410]|nr:hypothetical protein CN692_12230 [Bacillus sp. AFS002410]
MDTENGIIIDIHPSAGNINDCEPFVERLNVIQEKFELDIKNVEADRGYDTAPIHHGLKKLEITCYISPIKSGTAFDTMSYREFRYNNETDSYICPKNKELPFTHLKKSKGQYSKVFSAKVKECKICPFREKCFGKSSSKRTIERPIAHELTEANRKRSKTDEYRQIQKKGEYGVKVHLGR